MKQEAQEAFRKKEYSKAAELYQNLEKVSFFVEPSIRMNYAHANFILKKYDEAANGYQKILKYQDEELVSTALNQLAIISLYKSDSAKALQILKEAIQKNTENEVARYNYELLKMKFEPPHSSNSNQASQQQQELASGEVKSSDEKENELKSNNPTKMTREKALQLLDAMRSNESQNFNRKIGKKSGESSENDW